MSVKLRKRKNADGTVSLRLDIYKDGKRIIETLKHLQLAKPSNLADREDNKERLKQAESITLKRAGELEASNYNMEHDLGKKTMVVPWLQTHVDGYSKKDKRTMQGAVNKFASYLQEIKKAGLTFGNLDALLIEGFIDFLESSHTGEGAKSYYNRFKKMIKQAYRKRVMSTNILDFVERTAKGKAKKKDVLTIAELQQLADTPTESVEIRRAFLFTCFTGLRWCDIKSLQWKNINLDSSRLTIKQNKTGEELSTHLNEVTLNLLGPQGLEEAEVFNLPTSNGCNKTLKAWVKRAGIKKGITWHNGRHSFGTNLIYNNVDVVTTSKLLGHNSLRHTQRYVDTAEEMKRVATNKLHITL
jgi:integrase/recombinase XerD